MEKFSDDLAARAENNRRKAVNDVFKRLSRVDAKYHTLRIMRFSFSVIFLLTFMTVLLKVLTFFTVDYTTLSLILTDNSGLSFVAEFAKSPRWDILWDIFILGCSCVVVFSTDNQEKICFAVLGARAILSAKIEAEAYGGEEPSPEKLKSLSDIMAARFFEVKNRAESLEDNYTTSILSLYLPEALGEYKESSTIVDVTKGSYLEIFVTVASPFLAITQVLTVLQFGAFLSVWG